MQTAIQWLVKELEVYGEPTKLVIIWEDLDSLVKQAKEIEKEQMLNFPKEWKDSCLSGNYDGEVVELKSLEQYYNETYGSKGSDATSSQTEISVKKQVIEILDKIDYYYDLKGDADWLMNEIRSRLENVKDQTEISDDRTKLHWKTSLVIHTPEISDEEIEKGAKECFENKGKSIFWDYNTMPSFTEGAKWYREQLKSRQ